MSYRITCRRIGAVRWAGTREQAERLAAQMRQDVQTIGSPTVTITEESE